MLLHYYWLRDPYHYLPNCPELPDAFVVPNQLETPDYANHQFGLTEQLRQLQFECDGKKLSLRMITFK